MPTVASVPTVASGAAVASVPAVAITLASTGTGGTAADLSKMR